MNTATYQSCLDILGDSNRQTEERFAAMTQAFPRSVEFDLSNSLDSAVKSCGKVTANLNFSATIEPR